jgi:formate C-acetyltransferase
MMARLSADLSNIYASYTNRFGGNGKPVLLSFIWAPEAGAMLGASPDGRKAGVPVAHSVTPQSMSMTKGITAAMNSCTRMPFECFTGGASTMWDLDKNLATPEIVQSLFTTFFEQGGQIFQGNMTDVEELKKALDDPTHYGHVIVRVGGYSARFVTLDRALQEDIIGRMRHSK